MTQSEWKDLINHQDHTIELNGLQILVQNGVFTPNPEITYSSSILMKKMPKLKDKRVLDIGCGTGILSMYAASIKGARKVIGTDINPVAVENARENVTNNNLDKVIEIIKSDLFETLEGKFDYIVANLPIHNTFWNIKDCEDIPLNFLRECEKYIAPKGRVDMAWASFADLKPIIDTCINLKYNFRLHPLEQLSHTWYVFEIQF